MARPATWRGTCRDFLPTLFAHSIVAVSKRAINEARLYFRARQSFAVIPNGADPEIYSPIKRLETSPRVAFVGRAHDRVKNFSTLLEGSRLYFRQNPSFELWCFSEELENMKDDPFLRAKGHLAPSELAQTLRQCRALVLSSLYEGDPLVVREAQSMGLPLILSNIPQLREMAAGYPNSWFFEPSDPSSISSALSSFFSTDRTIEPVPSCRSWNDVAKEYAAFYSRSFA